MAPNEVFGLVSRADNSGLRGAATGSGEVDRFAALTSELAATGKQFYERGWVLGTSGNFSAVLSREPMRLAITSSGLDKGALDASSFIEMDETAHVMRGSGKPSAEALLHVAIVRELGAARCCTRTPCGARCFRARTRRAAESRFTATRC